MTADAAQPTIDLTRNQLLIWTGQQLWPKLPIYNEVAVFVIEGPVDHQHFIRAFQAVIDRTDVLRMAIAEREGVPFVQLRDQVLYAPSFVDLSHDVDPDRRLERWVQANAGVVFDLSQRWYEAALIKLSSERYAWYFVQHHIFTDATSNGIFFQRIADCYARMLEGNADHGPAYPGFLEYMNFERQYQQSSEFAENQAYWTHRLEKLRDTLTFYGVSVEAALRSKHQDRIHYALGSNRSSAIRRLARTLGTSAAVSEQMAIFSLFSAVLFVYLHHVSGLDYITIGVPWRNRPRRFLDTAGLLMEQAPFSVSLDAKDTFESVIRKVQAEAQEVRGRIPYVVGNPGGRLYSVVLNFQTHSLGSFAGMTVRTSIFHSEVGETSMALQIHSLGGAGDFAIEFDLNREVFASSSRLRVVRHFEKLLDACLADVSRAIHGVDILGDDEWALVRDWNATSREYPHDRTLVQLFEEQAARRADAMAVSCDGASLSYRQLNGRADALAMHLRTLGVRPGVLVGLCVERSPQMLVGLLATLKAGGGYVPLDPAFPAQRLAFMLEDSRASVLLTQTSLAGLLPVKGVEIVDLERLAFDDFVDGKAVPCAAGPDDLAYVLYTSGSTGKPKGVEIPHRALTNFLCAMREEPGCGEHDVLLAVTTLSFDIAGLELYLPLISGARVELASREEAADGRLLRERIEQVQPTLLQATPATWRMLIEAGWQGSPQLTALIGGEALPPDLVQPLLDRTKALWNLYGPTETTIWSSAKQVTSATEPITVGRPIANTTFYIVDQALQPVPIGVAGELLIGGEGLARGYRGRPELTAEKFIAHPFSNEPGARLYRTGDLARYRADGEVVHLGRMDQQVKVRGFRIELGEIEAALSGCAGVGQAVVDARADHTGTAVLVAYVVPADAQSVSAAELRQSLRQTLPEYMVPQYFVELEALPLTPNGKIDRKALPAPEAGAIGEAQTFVEPRNEIEAKVAAIFAELLQVERVGAHSDFFELGGHSLLAVRLMSRLAASFKVELPLQTLFEAPDVARLSDRISVLTGVGGRAAGEPRSPSRRAPCSATERRLLSVWERVLGTSGIGVQESFLKLQGSFDHVETMLDEVRREFGVRAEGLPLNGFLAEPTIEALAKAIEGGAEESSSLLVCLQPLGSRPPLFLVHAGGGYVFFYRALAARLKGRPIYGIRAATRTDTGELPFDRSVSVESIAARYVDELRKLQPRGPYALGGACFGGVIAFEMARQLLFHGERLSGPILLFDAFVIQQEPDAYAGIGEEYAMNRVAAHLARSSQLGLLSAMRYLAVKVIKNVPTAFVAVPPLMRRAYWRLRLSDAAIATMRRIGTAFGMPALVETAQKRTMERFLDATFRFLRNYRPSVLDASVVLFKAVDGPDPTRGWAGLARDGIVVHEMAGVHLDMMEEPAVAETASLVARYLEAEACGRQPAPPSSMTTAIEEGRVRSTDRVPQP